MFPGKRICILYELRVLYNYCIFFSLPKIWLTLSFLKFQSSPFQLSKVAYHGLFPSTDWDGGKLHGRYASFAGRRIAGGPHCLTELRGDWKWHHEMWNMKHFWKFKNGTCHCCRATLGKGPYQLPD